MSVNGAPVRPKFHMNQLGKKFWSEVHQAISPTRKHSKASPPEIINQFPMTPLAELDASSSYCLQPASHPNASFSRLAPQHFPNGDDPDHLNFVLPQLESHGLQGCSIDQTRRPSTSNHSSLQVETHDLASFRWLPPERKSQSSPSVSDPDTAPMSPASSRTESPATSSSPCTTLSPLSSIGQRIANTASTTRPKAASPKKVRFDKQTLKFTEVSSPERPRTAESEKSETPPPDLPVRRKSRPRPISLLALDIQTVRESVWQDKSKYLSVNVPESPITYAHPLEIKRQGCLAGQDYWSHANIRDDGTGTTEPSDAGEGNRSTGRDSECSSSDTSPVVGNTPNANGSGTKRTRGGGRGNRRSKKQTTPKDPVEKSKGIRYSCPFPKHHPERYEDVKNSCTSPVGIEWKYLIEHITRVHKASVRCIYCTKKYWETSDWERELENHMEECPARDKVMTKPECMSRAQEARYRESMNEHGQTDDSHPKKRWIALYQRLWPEAWSIPDPRYNYYVRRHRIPIQPQSNSSSPGTLTTSTDSSTSSSPPPRMRAVFSQNIEEDEDGFSTPDYSPASAGGNGFDARSAFNQNTTYPGLGLDISSQHYSTSLLDYQVQSTQTLSMDHGAFGQPVMGLMEWTPCPMAGSTGFGYSNGGLAFMNDTCTMTPQGNDQGNKAMPDEEARQDDS